MGSLQGVVVLGETEGLKALSCMRVSGEMGGDIGALGPGTLRMSEVTWLVDLAMVD